MHDDASWDDVRYFLFTHRCGGFGAAGRALEVQQSTVSRRVAALEARLGGQLFDRTAAGTRLTALGTRVLPSAEAVERALGHIGDAAALDEQEVEGVVRVAMTETVAATVVLPLVLPRLMQRYPRLRIDLVIGDHAADLARREADVAIRFFLPPRGDLVVKRLARLDTGVMATPTLAKSLRKVAPSSWPFVAAVLSTGEAPEEAWRRDVLGARSLRLTTNSFHTQFEAIRAGLGVGVLPHALARRSGLVVLPTTPSPPAVDAWLVTPRALRKVPRVAVVFDALLEVLATTPA